MPRPERRVAITGLGLVTPIGTGNAPFWTALVEGRSAVAKIQEFPVAGLPTELGGEIVGFDPKVHVIPRLKKPMAKSLKYMARDIQLAVAAGMLAFVDAGLDDGGFDPTRFGIDLGAGLICSDLNELAPAIKRSIDAEGNFQYDRYGREGIPEIVPIWLLRYLPNMLACHLSIMLDCQGPSNTITESEAASTLAIGEAARIIAGGRADIMLTGGADSKIHPMSMVRMTLAGQLTRWDGEPSRACRPFDANRGGTVPGEGAGMLILEEYEHAQARGAKIYGEILGAGSGYDAMPDRRIDPQGKGTEVAISAALKLAGLEPEAVGHVNAHGIGSIVSDRAEAAAFSRLFGTKVPVTSIKGGMGNLVSGCGAVDAIASLLAVNHQAIPPTINCDDLDPAFAIDLVRGSVRPTDNPIFVTTNLTRFGQAAALVVRGNPGVV